MNYKKIMPLLLICALSVTACDTKMASGSIKDTENEAVWVDSYGAQVSPKFEKSEYTVSYRCDKVKPDLSNVLNRDKISGFSDGQKKKLAENGFVVMGQKKPASDNDGLNVYTKMYNVYEKNEYLQFPNYITIDSSLNLYHLFFDGALREIEENTLYSDLKRLTEDMLKKTKEAYESEKDIEIKEKLENIGAYFAVADNLINDNKAVVSDRAGMLADKELKLIEEHSESAKSELVGREVNYKQFTPRGHYTKSDRLKKYFKTMMWYGLIPFDLENDRGEVNIENAKNAAAITYLTFLGDENGDSKLWDNIYTATGLFSGNSDDINIFDIKDLIIQVYGEKSDYTHYYSDEYDEKLKDAVKSLPEPEINARVISDNEKLSKVKSFKFMGQRYTLDANIMQDMMVPQKRPVPSGLDVAYAMGDSKAGELAEKYTLQNLSAEKYREMIEPLQRRVESLPKKAWMGNMYNGWLWVLDSLFNMDKEKMPPYMNTDAYKVKNINTALGSFAELKHDTVLYSKQPMAEKGDGPPDVKYPSVVEPQIEAYDKLIWLVEYSGENLKEKGLINKESEVYSGLDSLKELYTKLRDIAVKQVEGKKLDSEEIEFLQTIGAYYESMNMKFDEAGFSSNLACSLVSDVAYIADSGESLEMGTGYPDEIYVIAAYNGKPYIARGQVYSYYEFLSKKPLQDDEWFEMMGITKTPEGRYDIKTENFNSKMPNRPEWIGGYYSYDGNDIRIKEPEFN